MRILVLNAGSATVKVALVEVEASTSTAATRARLSAAREPDADLGQMFAGLVRELLAEHEPVDAVAHRVVHGGCEFSAPVRIDSAVERSIAALGRLAPLHNPAALAGIAAARARLPAHPQVAIFDTAFHSGRRPESTRYPLPWDECEANGLRRYGFHGIAHCALAESLAAAEGSRAHDVTAVTLQLGAGCSGCAVRRGRSIETSMGFSPLGGLPMATRAGDLDPGVLLELLGRGYAKDELEDLLTRRSGLRGVSGSSDMRDVLRAEAAGDERASVAAALFVQSVVGLVGAYLTFLRGDGAIVFGGGIGANASVIRARICAGLSAWDVDLDPERNEAAPGRISRDGKRPVYAFETDEERQMARQAYALLEAGGQ